MTKTKYEVKYTEGSSHQYSVDVVAESDGEAMLEAKKRLQYKTKAKIVSVIPKK